MLQQPLLELQQPYLRHLWGQRKRRKTQLDRVARQVATRTTRTPSRYSGVDLLSTLYLSRTWVLCTVYTQEYRYLQSRIGTLRVQYTRYRYDATMVRRGRTRRTNRHANVRTFQSSKYSRSTSTTAGLPVHCSVHMYYIVIIVRGRDPYRYGIGRSSSIHRMQIDLPEIDFNFQDPRMRRQAGLPAGSSLAFFDTPLVRTYAGVCCTHFWYWLPCARWSTTLPFHCSSREQVLPQQGP